MNTILITGSNGLTGQKILYGLLNRQGIRCVATSLGSNRTHARTGYEYEPLDITDKQSVDRIVRKYKPQALINTAAMTNVDQCELNPEPCRQLNVEAVRYLVDACEESNAHLVHLSTDFVFDGTAGPYSESDSPNPQSVYSRSKWEGEQIVMRSRMPWTIVRTIIIYGVVDDRQRSNLVLWAKNSLENKKDINVITDQYRSPTLAEDLADACIEAALRKATGLYHVSGNELKSIHDFVVEVADFFKLDKKYIHPVTTQALNQPAKRPLVTGFVTDKAKRDLGFVPRTFAEGLKIVEQQLSKPD